MRVGEGEEVGAVWPMHRQREEGEGEGAQEGEGEEDHLSWQLGHP